MSAKTPLSVRVRLSPRPGWCEGLLRCGLQGGKHGLVPAAETDDGWVLEGVVYAKPDPDGVPDFAGKLVHGKRGARFLYVVWVAGEGAHEHRFRRLKLHLTPTVRAGWEQAGVTWAQIEAGAIHADVRGMQDDGTPACGTGLARWT